MTDKSRRRTFTAAETEKLKAILRAFTQRSRQIQARLAKERADLAEIDNIKLPQADKARAWALAQGLIDKTIAEAEALQNDTENKLSEMLKNLDADSPQAQAIDEVMGAALTGYYKATYSPEIGEVYDLLYDPRHAELIEEPADGSPQDAERQSSNYYSHKLATAGPMAGNRLVIQWATGKLNQEGIMLPQYIRRLWMENHGPDIVSFDLNDYMRLRGLPMKNKAQTCARLEKEIIKLAEIRIYYQDEKQHKHGVHGFCGVHFRKGNKVSITLTQETINMFRRAGCRYHSYADALFKINTQDYQLAWKLGHFLCDIKSINWHAKEHNTRIMGTMELAEAAGLSVDRVRAYGSHFNTKFIPSLEKNLDGLADVIKWEYVGQGGREWKGTFPRWKKEKIKITYIKNPYDTMDKAEKRRREKVKRDARAAERERQKVRNEAKNKDLKRAGK